LPAFFRLVLAGPAASGYNAGHLDDWSARAGGVKVNAFI
jgi:hypothetical protein